MPLTCARSLAAIPALATMRLPDLQFKAAGRPKVLQRVLIRSGEAPPAQLGVGGKQAVERITRPADIGRFKKPCGRWRLVEHPSFVLEYRLQGSRCQAKPARLVEHLELEQHRRRNEQPPIDAEQRACARPALFDPQERL